MKFGMLLLVTSLALVSCGGGNGGSSGPSEVHPNPTPIPAPVTTPPSVVEPVTILPMNYNAPHKTYIIGGQSNAVRLLYTMTGVNTDSSTNLGGLIAGTTPKIDGYAVGNTGIDYWLIPANSQPLVDVLTAKCNLSPYFVWYQGEADTGTILDGSLSYLTYQAKLATFFNRLITVCPAMAIIEVSLALDPSQLASSHGAEIIQIQRNLGLPVVDALPYANQYGFFGTSHLVDQGYVHLFNEITTRFPLN